MSWTAALVLMQRDLRNVARSRSQLYSSMMTPLLLLLFLGAGVSHGLEPSALRAGNFSAFLVPGVILMTLVFSATFSSASYYRDRDTGVLRVLLASPQSPRAIMLGKSLAGVVIGALQGAVVLAVAAPFVDLGWQYGIAYGSALAAGIMLLAALLLAGVSQMLASRIATMQGFHLVMNLALFPLLFVSGAFFPLEGVPVWLRVLAYTNPLTYAVDGLQLATYADGGDGFIGLPIDLAVLGGATAVAFASGLARVPRLTWSGR